MWNQHLHLDRHVSMTVFDDRGLKTRVKMWVMDAIFMANCKKLAVTTTGRDVKFYDLTSNQFNEEYQLYGRSQHILI